MNYLLCAHRVGFPVSIPPVFGLQDSYEEGKNLIRTRAMFHLFQSERRISGLYRKLGVSWTLPCIIHHQRQIML